MVAEGIVVRSRPSAKFLIDAVLLGVNPYTGVVFELDVLPVDESVVVVEMARAQGRSDRAASRMSHEIAIRVEGRVETIKVVSSDLWDKAVERGCDAIGVNRDDVAGLTSSGSLWAPGGEAVFKVADDGEYLEGGERYERAIDVRNIAGIIGALALIVAIGRSLGMLLANERRAWRTWRGRCPHCNYILKGDSRCPECGGRDGVGTVP